MLVTTCNVSHNPHWSWSIIKPKVSVHSWDKCFWNGHRKNSTFKDKIVKKEFFPNFNRFFHPIPSPHGYDHSKNTRNGSGWHLFGSDRSSRNVNLRLFVRSCQTCLEQSIFIILAQIFKQSVRNKSAVREHSESTQRALREHSEST